MAGFEFKYDLVGEPGRSTRQYIIGASKTVTVGDAVHLETGYVDPAAATERIIGFVQGFVDNNGLPLDHSQADFDGTYTASTNTYVATSDNTTDKKIRAIVNISPTAVYSATPDATIGTTTGSNLHGYFCDLIDEDSPDESDAVTTAQQLAIHGLDPNDSTKGLYSIAEHQIFGL